jgi:hypothetical protein
VSTTVSGTCSNCGRARTSEPFCECGALFDYSVPAAAVAEPPPPADAADGKDGADTDAGEWPPGRTEPVHPRPATTGAPALPVVRCTNESCGAVNPEYASFCWKCGTALVRVGEARTRWSLRRALGLEQHPLPDGVLCTNESCGAANVEYASFCWKCGKALVKVGEARKRWSPRRALGLEQQPIPTGVLCTNEACGAANPDYASFCWRCGTALVKGGEARKRRSLRRSRKLEKQALPAGERTPARGPLFTRGRLGAALLVVAAVVALGALAIGIDKAWRPAAHGVARGYDVSREALWPQFEPVYPSSVNPPRHHGPIANVRLWRRHVNPVHPPFDAFDRNLSTYWQSVTPRQQPDRIRANFKPAAPEIDEVSIYAGDPTGATIVPQTIQMTFYRWEPHPIRTGRRPRKPPHRARPCPRPFKPPRPAPGPPSGLPPPSGVYCVAGVGKVFHLQNTPAVQRFSTGAQHDISMVVITVRGVHRADNPNAKAAITDIEFFRRH